MSAIERFTGDPKTSTVAVAGEVWHLSQRIAQTEFVPTALRGRPEAVMAAILVGHEAGISPMQSLAKIHIIEGRPAFSAELMRGLIFAAGHEFWIEESSSTRCVVGGKRAGSERETRVTWTLDDAQRAGLKGKKVWQSYPTAMLLARATAALARAVFPDVLAGLSYTAEELSDGDVDLVELTPGGAPEQPPATTPPPRTARASRAATRGSSAPAATEPEPAPKRVAPEPALPGEDDEVLDGELEDVVGDVPAPDAGDEPVDAELVDDQPSDGYEGPDQHIQGGGASYTGPQLLAIKLGERGVKDREERLAVISAILEVDSLSTTKDLQPDEVSLVAAFIDAWPSATALPGQAGYVDDVDDADEPPAETDEAVWTGDQWRAFLKERGVKVVALLKEAQHVAREAGHPGPGTLDDLTDPALAARMRAFVEDQAAGGGS